MSDRQKDCLAITKKAVYQDPGRIAEIMDALLSAEQAAFINSMAQAHDALGICRESTSTEMAKENAAILLLVKAQNDILAGHLLLRSGYNKRSIYFIRLALESISQSILVFRDANYYAAFKSDRAQAYKSIGVLERQLPLVGLDDQSNNYISWLSSRKQTMNLHSHSTVYATLGDYIGMQSTYGPGYDHNKIDEYKSIQRELSQMASLLVKLAEWMGKQMNKMTSNKATETNL